jgi:hypothetical protein
MTLDGRVTVPGSRWVSGEESRRRVHELRTASDAVAVGMGTVRADDPALTARDVGAARQPRRLAFGQGPLPEGSELELRSGPLEGELAALAGEGVAPLRRETDAGLGVLAAGSSTSCWPSSLRACPAGPGPVARLPEPIELLRH